MYYCGTRVSVDNETGVLSILLIYLLFVYVGLGPTVTLKDE